jgi:hypothetical protein
MATIACTGIIISIEYPGEDARWWARLYDNRLQGLIVDETGAAEAKPVIIGQFPLAATATAPILSPQWASFEDPTVVVPDLLRASLAEFLTWLATNNGAHRPLQARFGLSPNLMNGFAAWANHNPDLVFEGDPPPPPEGTRAATAGGHNVRH